MIPHLVTKIRRENYYLFYYATLSMHMQLCICLPYLRRMENAMLSQRTVESNKLLDHIFLQFINTISFYQTQKIQSVKCFRVIKIGKENIEII